MFTIMEQSNLQKEWVNVAQKVFIRSAPGFEKIV